MDTMKAFTLAFALLVGCGGTEAPIKTEAEADGGCWQPQECAAGVGDLSGGPQGGLCDAKIGGRDCIAGHSGGQTCWFSSAQLSVYFVSSCQECETLSRCP